MRERKSTKSNVQQQNQQQQHQNGHLSPFKFAKLFDPEASWDKVSVLCFFTWYYFMNNVSNSDRYELCG